jgi:hypothetical protein
MRRQMLAFNLICFCFSSKCFHVMRDSISIEFTSVYDSFLGKLLDVLLKLDEP